MHLRRKALVPVSLVVLGILVLVACDPITVDQRALYTTQASVTITGSVTARNGDAMTSVVVNGVAATISGTSFSAAIPVNGGPTFVPVLVTAHFQSGFSEIQRSTVARANSTSVTLVAKAAAVANAIVTRLRPSALTKLGPTMTATVTFPSSVFAIPPTDLGGDVFDAQILSGGTTTLSSPTLAFDISGSTVRAVNSYATVHQVVPIQVQGFLGAQTCTLDVALGPLAGTSTYSLAPDATAGFRATPAAAPTASATLTGTTGCTATSTVATAIDNAAAYVANTTQQILAAVLADPDGAGSAEAPLAAGLEQALAGINVSGAIGGAGTGVTLAAPIASIGLTTDGIGASDTSTYTSSAVASSAPAQSSSLAFGATAAVVPGAIASSYDWAAGASVATINQLLAADTERGQLNRSVTTIGGQPLTYNKLDTLVGLGGPISPDRSVKVAVIPELAPAVTAATGTSPAVGAVHLGGLRATVSFTDNNELLLDAVLDADGAASVALAAGNVVVSASGFTISRQDLLGNPRSLAAGQASGILAALLNDVAGPVHTGLALFPAPTVPGLTAATVTSMRTGSGIYLFGTYS